MDTDGDGKANLVYFRPSSGDWVVRNNNGTSTTTNFGLGTDTPVPADYDGDNKDDVAVFRPSNGTWYIRKSSDGTTTFTPWGSSGDKVVPGDYDGDGKDDIAVYRNGVWYINRSTSGALIQAFGVTTDRPVPTAYITGN